MKNPVIYSLVACLVLSGCSKGLKDETYSTYDDNTLTLPENGEQAVVGAYAALKDDGGYGYYAGYLYWLYEYPDDVVTTSATSKQGVQLDQLTYDASNSVINDVWASVFTLISRANEANYLIGGIDYVDNGSTAAEKAQNLGEVRFLRALAYYDATDLWGDVPLILKPSSEFTSADLDPKLTSQAIVEDSMIEDLKYAETNLPSSYPATEVARATSGAASSLLARLYMRQEDWTDAASEALKVINSGNYALSSNIVNLFSLTDRTDKEFIFVLTSSSDNAAYGINSNSFGINSVPWDYNRGWGNFPIFLSFYSIFDSTDARRNLLSGIYLSIYGEYVSVPKAYGGPGGSLPDTTAAIYAYNLKYPSTNEYNYSGYNNVTILRYADVLLMRAEALNELNGPNAESFTLINEVRARAGIAAITQAEYATKSALRDALFLERDKEFFMEGRRRDDLLRWGETASGGTDPLSKFREYVEPTLTDSTTYSTAVNYAVYPYPESELETNTSISSSLNTTRVRQ